MIRSIIMVIPVSLWWLRVAVLYVSTRRLCHNTLLSDLMVHLIRYAKKTEDAEGVTVGKRSDRSPELWAESTHMEFTWAFERWPLLSSQT